VSCSGSATTGSPTIDSPGSVVHGFIHFVRWSFGEPQNPTFVAFARRESVTNTSLARTQLEACHPQPQLSANPESTWPSSNALA
jgi:hypothetical protein